MERLKAHRAELVGQIDEVDKELASLQRMLDNKRIKVHAQEAWKGKLDLILIDCDCDPFTSIEISDILVQEDFTSRLLLRALDQAILRDLCRGRGGGRTLSVGHAISIVSAIHTNVLSTE